jgi:hypothetical protein
VDGRVPEFLGRVLDGRGRPVGTCFQITPRVVATARHVLLDAIAAAEGEGSAEDSDVGASGEAGGLIGAHVMVDGLAVGSAAPQPASVVAVDPAHDLAVARLDTPLPGVATALAGVPPTFRTGDLIRSGLELEVENAGTA